MKRISFRCDRCGKDVDLSIYDFNKNQLKYSGNFCRGCRQHFQYENGSRDKDLIKKSVKPQKGVSMKERCHLSDEEYNQLKEKRSLQVQGKSNPMYGDHNHTKGLEKYNESRKGKTWEEVYGKELSDKMKERMSERQIGEKNHMFGKPAPTGSGNGWSGWYKGLYFRSLLELSFIIENPDVENAETIKIPYNDYDNSKRTYHPDFKKGNVIYEIKPKNLLNSATNKLKFEAANDFCKSHMLIYKIVTEEDVHKLTNSEIKRLHDSGELKFIERYEEMYHRRSQ